MRSGINTRSATNIIQNQLAKLSVLEQLSYIIAVALYMCYHLIKVVEIITKKIVLNDFFLESNNTLTCNLNGLKCVMNVLKPNISDYITANCKCINNCGYYNVFLIGLVSNFKSETKNLRYVQHFEIHLFNFFVFSVSDAEIQHQLNELIS